MENNGLEEPEHIAFVTWFRWQFPALLFHIPNGELRDSNRGRAAIRGKKLKAMGVIKGVLDLFVPEWFLWIEMKRCKGGRLTPEQKDFKERMEKVGYYVIVANGCDDGIVKVKEFLRRGIPTLVGNFSREAENDSHPRGRASPRPTLSAISK